MVPDQNSQARAQDSSTKISGKETKQTIDLKAVSDYKERLHYIVEGMNRNLGQISLTGNPEHDFARLMTSNLLSGIGICLLHQKNGIDSTMKQFAQRKQIYLQKQEDYFDQYQFNSNNSYSPSIKKKAPTLKHLNVSKAANEDVVFAAIISEYNRNTIDLAKEYLKTGANQEMKKAAQNLVQNFSKELILLKKYIE